MIEQVQYEFDFVKQLNKNIVDNVITSVQKKFRNKHTNRFLLVQEVKKRKWKKEYESRMNSNHDDYNLYNTIIQPPKRKFEPKNPIKSI